jgi:hypothetical protein
MLQCSPVAAADFNQDGKLDLAFSFATPPLNIGVSSLGGSFEGQTFQFEAKRFGARTFLHLAPIVPPRNWR